MFESGPLIGLDVVDMEIVELPGDIVDSSEQVELSVVVIHSMPVSYCRDFSLVFQPVEFEVSEAETPNIVESLILVFSSEDKDAVSVSGNSATDSWTRDI